MYKNILIPREESRFGMDAFIDKVKEICTSDTLVLGAIALIAFHIFLFIGEVHFKMSILCNTICPHCNIAELF
jgi:hypothetical protein